MLRLLESKHSSAATTVAAAIAILLTSYFGFGSIVQGAEVRHPSTNHNAGDGYKPTGKGWGEFDPSGMAFAHANKFSRTSTNGISYHGGPVITGTKNIYYIWYGNWSGNSATEILCWFAGGTSCPGGTGGIGGSPYFNINSTYYQNSNTPANIVSNSVTLAKSINGPSTYGTSLSDSDIQNIVASAINSTALPSDPDGVYFVLTSADVNETSGFCTRYCGWHTRATIGGQDIKYSFVGNPDRCPSACAYQTTGPNGNAGADGMANIIAHELSEAATDPDLNAWYDNRGYENADKCAWKFGTMQTASNGSKYNVTFGSKQYLVQQNWANANGGSCSLQY